MSHCIKSGCKIPTHGNHKFCDFCWIHRLRCQRIGCANNVKHIYFRYCEECASLANYPIRFCLYCNSHFVIELPNTFDEKIRTINLNQCAMCYFYVRGQQCIQILTPLF